jgi:16S rRNA (cytosine967-C5)-methyltransferase
MLAGLLCARWRCSIRPRASEPPYEAFTVVDQAVGAAAAHPDFAHAKAMVNAVLRRFLREREQLVGAALRSRRSRNGITRSGGSTRYAPPIRQLAGDPRGRQPPAAADPAREPRKTSVDDVPADAGRGRHGAEPVGPSAVRLAQAMNVARSPASTGLVSVQDAGAQLAAPLLDLHDGMRVLDACAAPGGKSGHILETADVDLTALDADAAACARSRRTCSAWACPRRQGRRRRRRRAGGTASVRPHPGRRAVHGLRHRAAPPGYPLVATQERHPPTCNTFQQNTRQPLADAAARW